MQLNRNALARRWVSVAWVVWIFWAATLALTAQATSHEAPELIGGSVVGGSSEMASTSFSLVGSLAASQPIGFTASASYELEAGTIGVASDSSAPLLTYPLVSVPALSSPAFLATGAALLVATLLAWRRRPVFAAA